jgi:fido (protein-threonine AMPylation protein)
MRIWLDLILKKELKKVVDWNSIDASYYYEGYTLYKTSEIVED